MVVPLWIFSKVEKHKNNSLSCSPTTSHFYKRKHRGVTYPKSKRSDHFTPYLITFPLAYKGLFLLMNMRRKDTSFLSPSNFFPAHSFALIIFHKVHYWDARCLNRWTGVVIFSLFIWGIWASMDPCPSLTDIICNCLLSFCANNWGTREKWVFT